MHIEKKMLQPSREDAVRITRSEKMAMLEMAYIATVFEDIQKDLSERLTMVEDGTGRMALLSQMADALLNDLRLTVPMNQRMSLQNMAIDYEIRLTPKMTPTTTRVIMEKEEFRELVDIARVKCRECTETDESCKVCKLFTLLTSVLPLDDYSGMLCPYNMGEWGN